MGMPGSAQVERVNEVAFAPIAYMDIEYLYNRQRGVIAGVDLDGPHPDARLPTRQGQFDVALDQGPRGRGVGLHQVAAQPAAERRPHDPLAWLRVEDEQYRL